MSKITHFPKLAKIKYSPNDPIEMLKYVLNRVQAPPSFPMNVATIDKEFGILARTVMYRGILDNSSISFVTERNTRKYPNLKDNPKLGVTILISNDVKQEGSDHVVPETWQIRLLDAEAVEVDDEQLRRFWNEEPLFAKIRSQICECGKPNTPEDLERRFQTALSMVERGNNEPQKTETYTAFKIVPKRWDFYKSEPNAIADRLQYKQLENGKWEHYHVDP
ncbi:pyridoxine/pyridoxamine 5'-phosphate oxidase [Haematobia irritans]|uniref:pyridoxine/pyridoxamine 5'-phosphate oxidase n=1 Tax=Haematobia irritans TaxID=7368 RepID=UPI003F5043CD